MGQFMTVPLIDRDLTGQTLIVTGSNTGLGMEAAKHFARMNPEKIIMAVRNVKKGNEAKDKIQAETKFNNIEVRELDLCSFDSVRAFADSIQKTEKRLDVVISNAGVANSTRNMTKDGWEETIQVNHLSNMLLLILLVPLLRKSAEEFNIEPRIVVVASGVHAWTQFTEEGKAPEILKFMNDQKDMSKRYPTSKLLNVLMTRKFATVFPDITIHCLDPGLCKTELSRDANFIKNLLFQLFRNLVGRTAEQGSRTLVHAAIYEGWFSKNIPNARYFSSCIEYAPTIQARNKDYQDRLWMESEKILLAVEPKIASIIENKKIN